MVRVRTTAEVGKVPMPRPTPAETRSSARAAMIHKTASVTTKIGEPLTAKEVKDWRKLQVPYPNLASDPAVVERARQHMLGHIRDYEDSTVELRDKWVTHQFHLRGNTLSHRFADSDIHVGETYKAVETLVPIIEEALGQFDPGFYVKGVEAGDRKQQDKIRWWLQHLLRQARWEQKQQPNIRAGLTYAYSPIKTTWDVQIDRRLERKHKRRETKAGKVTHTQTIEEKEVVTYWGPRIDLVDPLNFFVDTQSSDPPHDTLFMGDTTTMTIDEIKAKEKAGIFVNTAQLDKVEPAPDMSYTQFDKRLRSLEFLYGREEKQRQPGEPKRFEVQEEWCSFDPYGDGQHRQYVLTMVDKKYIVRVQENPHDDKHKPYALARLGREGFEFFGVGPLDHALRINIEMDEHRNTALRGHYLSISPLAFMPDTTEVPDNIFDVEPGSTFQSATPPTWFAPKPVIGEMQALESTLRRDIEELTGAYRIHEQPNQTATEVERKVQVRNMRARANILAYSHQMKEVLSQLHSLSKQWVTREMTFRVLGKSAKGLDLYTQIGPEDFGPEVDFEMIGPAALKTLGLRATNLTTFLNLAYPIFSLIPQQTPDGPNYKAMLRELYVTIVGTRPADEILPDNGDMSDLMTQEEENLLLLEGQIVEVHPQDDDDEHMSEMAALMPDGELHGDMSPAAQRVAAEHYMRHLSASEEKKVQQAAAQRQQAQAPQEGMDPGRGTTGNRRMDMTNGNPGQTPPGEAPGTPSLHSMAAPDRNQPTPQSENHLG